MTVAFQALPDPEVSGSARDIPELHGQTVSYVEAHFAGTVYLIPIIWRSSEEDAEEVLAELVSLAHRVAAKNPEYPQDDETAAEVADTLAVFQEPQIRSLAGREDD